MSKVHLKVKAESTATRCEICHQADCFNSFTGSCSRCAEIYQPGSLAAIVKAADGVSKPVRFAFPNLLRASRADKSLKTKLSLAAVLFCSVLTILSSLQALIGILPYESVRWVYRIDLMVLIFNIFLLPVGKVLSPIFSYCQIGPLESLVYMALLFLVLTNYCYVYHLKPALKVELSS